MVLKGQITQELIYRSWIEIISICQCIEHLARFFKIPQITSLIIGAKSPLRWQIAFCVASCCCNRRSTLSLKLNYFIWVKFIISRFAIFFICQIIGPRLQFSWPDRIWQELIRLFPSARINSFFLLIMNTHFPYGTKTDIIQMPLS